MWENNIKMNLWEVGSENLNWIQLAQDRVPQWTFLNMVMDIYISYKQEMSWSAA